MPNLRFLYSEPRLRWLIPAVIGLLGLSLTLWIDRSLTAYEQERFEQRFQQSAQEHAESLVRKLREPLEHLSVLQRLFGSVERVDWKTFQRFTEPMLNQPGSLNYSWLPRVNDDERADFEQAGRNMLKGPFAIEERDAAGRPVPAPRRNRYFPILFSVPDYLLVRYGGYNVTAVAAREQLINRAIEQNLAVAGEFGPMLIDNRQKDLMMFFAPVYKLGSLPESAAARQADICGVLVAAVNIVRLFDLANGSFWESGFATRLLDKSRFPEVRPIAAWPGESTDLLAQGTQLPSFTLDFSLANQAWAVRVEATPEWIVRNRYDEQKLVIPFGLLVSIGLSLFVHVLFRRLAVADLREAGRQKELLRHQETEIWANKLSMAVEQNPAAILIMDLSGNIEYVNSTFVAATGYSRGEVMGRHASLLRPEGDDESVYLELWESTRAGQTWQGDLQTRRRDGGLYWDRVQVSPIRGRDGRITNFVSVRQNINELRETMLRLGESESRFLRATEVMAEAMAILSPEGVYLHTNRTFDELMGCSDAVARGKSPKDFPVVRLHEDGSVWLPEDYPAYTVLRTGHSLHDLLMGFRYADGRVRWVLVNASPLAMGDEGQFGVVVTFLDVTERRLAEERLKMAFEAIRCSGEGILITDSAHVVLSVNPAFETMTGYAADEVIGRTPAVVASGRHDEGFFRTLDEMLARDGYWQGEIWNQRKNGDVFPEWLGVSVIRDDLGRPKSHVYIYSDMTERKETQRRIEFLAHHDVLTGLPNRLLLRDRMQHALVKANRMQTRVALIYLDLDRFKTINDSLGHPVGDALLKEVVERLKRCVRESDTISRQGGDEFIIIVDDVRDRDSVARVADKIHLCMAEPVLIDGHSLNTSFSMGIVLYPDDGEGFDALLQKADTAMYHAKAAGRNAHRFFTEQMNLQVVEHLNLETHLRKALELQEFVLHYQPQLDLHDNRIIGVEALIRWNSPGHGLVSPARFIPVAEDSGLIVQIGAWVLMEACRQARAWQDAGLPPFVVAVNLSAVQFKRPDLVNTVINALVLAELDSEWLELELTESILIQDTDSTLDSVRRLKSLGVKLSVDDFGTGYSSLAYLKRFAVDKLKIDQSFVRDLVSDPDDAAIVRAIIQMAHSLKLRTIAEGVESAEISALLRLFNCNEIQGYAVARPMPAEELEIFVREHLARSIKVEDGQQK